jgi:hypothetical protein
MFLNYCQMTHVMALELMCLSISISNSVQMTSVDFSVDSRTEIVLEIDIVEHQL